MSKCRAGKRTEILSMFDWRCAYCASPIDEDNGTLDHKIPKIYGGTRKHSNLFPCCCQCNNLKSDRSIEEFRNYLAIRLNEVWNIGFKPTIITFLFEK